MSDHLGGDAEDPAQNAVQRTLRTALMTATVAAEQITRLRRQHTEQAAQQHREEAARMGKQYDAHRALAVAELGAADERWFHRAEPQQVARIWAIAHTWEQLEPEMFSPYAERLRERINARYGIDDRDLPTGAAETADRLRAGARDPAAEQRHEQVADAADQTAADTLLATASDDRTADEARSPRVHTDADLAAGRFADLTAEAADYDSVARREALASRATQPGTDADTVAGRVRASHAQAEPVRAATRPQNAGARSKLADPSKARTRSSQRSAQLDR